MSFHAPLPKLDLYAFHSILRIFYIYVKNLLFFWQVGLVDSFSMIKFCVNAGSQYGAIVVAAAAGNFSEIGPKTLFEPVFGLGTSYQTVFSVSIAFLIFNLI